MENWEEEELLGLQIKLTGDGLVSARLIARAAAEARLSDRTECVLRDSQPDLPDRVR